MSETALIVIQPGEIEQLSDEEIAAWKLEAALTTITLDVLDSEHSRRAYRRALNEFWEWHRGQGRPALQKAVVQRYAAELKKPKVDEFGMDEPGMTAANINQRLSAIRRMAKEASEAGLVDQKQAESIAAVEGISASGSSVGIWLSLEEAQSFLDAIDHTSLAGKRDRALIAMFLSSGLRRSEMASLTLEHLGQVENRWVILGIVGKRNKTRDVPIAAWAKSAVDVWCLAAGISRGIIFRPVNKSDRVGGKSLSPEGIRKLIDRQINLTRPILAEQGIKLPDGLAAHDLRRSFAQLARKGGVPLEQIQFALGHQSVATTEKYLGGKQDMVNAPCDSLGLNMK